AIWSHSHDLRAYYNWRNGFKVYEGDPSTTDDDIVVGPYTMQPENAGLGVLVHELGHNLFGLPDLYTNDADNSVAAWDPWGSGAHNGPLSGAIPVGMSLWMRYMAFCDVDFCNWQEPIVERDHNDPTADVLLGQLEDTPQGSYKGIKINLPPVQLWTMNYAGAGKGAYSGSDRNEVMLTLDRNFTLPSGAPNILTFSSGWDIEEDWDYGFVLLKDGTSWVALDDIDGALREDDPFENNVYGHGLTGEGYTPLRFDLSSWAGKTVTIRFVYRTDESVTNWGWWIDDLKLDGAQVEEFESAEGSGTFPNWTNSSPGWLVAPYADEFPNYYMVEWRSDTKYDGSLKSYRLTKQFDAEGWQVQRVPYNIPGALLYYRNTLYPFSYSMADNKWQDPSPGPKHQLLVVDMNPNPLILSGSTPSDDIKLSASIGGYDATLSHQAAPQLDISQVMKSGTTVAVGPWTIPPRTAVGLFDDSKEHFAGVYTGDPLPDGYFRFWGDDSAVIPARGRYSVRHTNYAGVVQPDMDIVVNGFRFGTGQPVEDAVQHGVQVQLLPSGGDPKQNLIRVAYAAPAAGPNLEITQGYPEYLLVGARGYYSFTVANVGLGPTTKQITVHDYLPAGVSFLSGGGGGWTCSESGGLVTCVRDTPLQAGERSRLELNVRVDRRVGIWGANEVEASTEGDTSTKNNGSVEYSEFVSARTLYFPQVADGSIPGGKFQTTVVLVNTGAETPVQLEVYDSSGHEMLINVDWLGSANQVSPVLLTGESLTFQTSGQGALRVGYAKLIAPESVNGTAVFSFTENNVTLYEAG
ncbi:MAG: hypothetical protein EHM61_28665, partial [Acidobacteria bacterium]